MTDEVKLEVAPDEDAKRPEKQYTQAEVDRLLNMQKAKIKPLADELEKYKTGQDETLKAYEVRIGKLVTDMAKEIPPSILKLLAKLSPLEQLDYLADPENEVVFEKKAFPLPKKKVDGKKEIAPTPVDNFL